ncbi:farnesyl pyrophosphate synthase [Neoconidiobolus thromboides FSU 785]|nr:farnesyl pyrophosphate synthase [Neoconidiobolus thromboides FSU 785]
MSSKQQFIDHFDRLAEDIISEVKTTGMNEESVEWVKKMLYHNVPGGKLNRGLSVVDTLKIISSNNTEKEIEQAIVLGWCVEFLQAFFLVADDLMDSSITRRGNPCWYRMPGVNTIAVNDAFILESCIYVFLKKYFKTEDYYVELLEAFHQVSWQTELGQLVDLLTAPEDDVDLNRFSVEKQHFISKYKTAFYSFYLPVALALYMKGIKDEESHKIAKDILIPIGEYFQIQDDYLDCYGDPEFIGKIGTDIQDNKCSWLIGKALLKANEEQKKVLHENYGQKDDAKATIVKGIYKELDLENEYLTYEQNIYEELIMKIDAISESNLKPEIFSTFLNKIYKRTK